VAFDGFGPITTAESPRWKSAQMSIWAAEAGFSPVERQFFLGFRIHLLVSNTGAICDFVLSPANVGERQVAERGNLCAIVRLTAVRCYSPCELRPCIKRMRIFVSIQKCTKKITATRDDPQGAPVKKIAGEIFFEAGGCFSVAPSKHFSFG